MESEIYERIPHRPPFLWVDRIISIDSQTIVAEKYFAPDLDMYAGHYPHHPITPGVILCEAIIQAGAVLIADILQREGTSVEGVPVLTRIYGARFKRSIKPGDTVRLVAHLKEVIGAAWLLKGKVLVEDKVAVSLDFGCTIT
nr:beta-hydroxyacyl-ACP dehydratase [Desulfobulbaceae bacterium]